MISDGSPIQKVRLDPDQCEKEKEGDAFVLKSAPSIRVDSRAYKMSKSRGNVINPEGVVAEYGADALRLYEMFMGPLEQVKPWSMNGVSGVKNFLDRVWRMIVDEKAEEHVLSPSITDGELTKDQTRILHATIMKVTQDIDALKFNTAISRMMEFTNDFTKMDTRPRAAIEPFILLLSPFAPHIAEELWRLLGRENTLAYEPWPEYDEALTQDSNTKIAIQIMGKVRSVIELPRGMAKDEVLAAAKADERIAELIAGKTIVKEIVVPDKLVNIVAK